VKVHISVDMEGISGVADPADTTPGAPHYEYCRRLMTAECNAAIEGCFEGGATEIVVNDSHGPMVNLLQESLDRRAKIIRGRSKSLGMMQGIDEQTAATVFIGYHAAAGHDDGVLNHTMRGRDIQGVFLNDEPAGEMRLNAALAGWFGIPVALVSGDDVLCAEVREQLGPVDKYTALSVHPEVAQELIRDAARRAVQRVRAGDSGQAPPPYRVETPTTLRLAWNSTNIAALCENIPGVRRIAPREIEYTSADYPEIYRLLRVLLAVAGYCASAAYTYD
jgi:D-amino peptidase